MFRQCSSGPFVSLRDLLSLFLLCTVSGLMPTKAVAAITATGDFSPANPASWTSSTTGYVGNTSSGTLTIDSGSVVHAGYSYLGYNAGATGAVTVSSGGSWTGNGDLQVGFSGNGTLTVNAGGTVSDVNGLVANGSHSTSTVSVTGAQAKWINSNNVIVGDSGSGTLNISAGGAVSNSAGYIGGNAGPGGIVTVDGTGSTWTGTGNLYLAEGANGSLSITNGGAASDLACYIGGFASSTGKTGTVTVDGRGSTWTHGDALIVGYANQCSGTVSVSNGATLRSFSGTIGYNSGSTGAVSISGAGSTWTNSAGNLNVGYSSKGTLNVTAGGTINDGSGGATIGVGSGSTGVATLDGATSKWTEADILTVGGVGTGTFNVTHGAAFGSSRFWLGYTGTGTLKIAGGGTVSVSDTSYIGVQGGGRGVATINGAGSAWNNTGSLYVGYNSSSSGSVTVVGGGTVTASSVSINSASLVAVDAGRGSSLRTTGTFTNNGKLRVLAGTGVKAGNTYAPVSAGAWSGTGTVQAVGGTWNASNHQFTASAVPTGTSGAPVAIDLASVQRLLVTDNATGWSLGESFAAKTASTSLTLTATKISDGSLTALDNILPSGQSVLGGWLFSASGYASGDPAYMSFGIGAGYSEDSLELWRYSGSTWAAFSANDLTYDGKYASFTANDLSGYAVTGTAVPEPSTLVLLSLGAASLLAYAWRRRAKAA